MDSLPLIAKTLNTVILFVLVFGIYKRRQPRVHIPVMLVAFVVDLGNVLMVEVYARSKGKGAVEQALEQVQGVDATFLEQFHILVSTLCILGYLVAVVTGTLLYRRGKARRVHRANAWVFGVTRLASYVTSFWMGG